LRKASFLQNDAPFCGGNLRIVPEKTSFVDFRNQAFFPIIPPVEFINGRFKPDLL